MNLRSQAARDPNICRIAQGKLLGYRGKRGIRNGMKKFLTAILCVACVSFSMAGCAVNATRYESKAVSASINIFTNTNLKNKLGNVSEFALTSCFEEDGKADAEGYIVYRRELKDKAYEDAVKEIEEQVRAIQIKTEDSNNGLSQKDYDKGFRLLILEKTAKVMLSGIDYVESKVSFLSFTNLHSTYYKVNTLESYTGSNKNEFIDARNGNTTSLASITDTKGKYVVTIGGTNTRANNIPVRFDSGLLAYNLSNDAAKATVDGNALIPTGLASSSTDKIFALVGESGTPNLTWVIVVAAVLLVAFVTLLVLKLTVLRRKA